MLPGILALPDIRKASGDVLLSAMDFDDFVRDMDTPSNMIAWNASYVTAVVGSQISVQGDHAFDILASPGPTGTDTLEIQADDHTTGTDTDEISLRTSTFLVDPFGEIGDHMAFVGPFGVVLLEDTTDSYDSAADNLYLDVFVYTSIDPPTLADSSLLPSLNWYVTVLRPADLDVAIVVNGQVSFVVDPQLAMDFDNGPGVFRIVVDRP